MAGLLPSLSRRRRRVAVTAALFAGFSVVGALAVLGALRSGETYTPGGDVEGLTRDLARDLPDDPPDVRFTDVTERAGIGFHHFPHRRTGQLPEDMGSGAAWGDYDDDGWPDLFLVDVATPLPGGAGGEDVAERHPSGRSVLYRNRGDGTFRDVTEEAGIDHRAPGMAAAWGDYDGDGRLDLVVTAYGENALYRNEGDGTFTDRSGAAGLAGLAGFWTGAVWGDYDGDGDLDLYVTGYVRYSPGAGAGATVLQYDVEVPASLNPSAFRPERNLLLENRGDGTFRDVAERAGVAGLEGRGLGAVWADFDEDGRLDLYVANDVSDNALYRNRGDGTFEDVSHEALVADYRGAMGLAVGDWDGDLDMDLFITHWIAQENALFSNRLRDGAGGERASAAHPRPLQFMDEADRFGLGQVGLDYIGWGTSFFDYDNDGRPDLLVVNGSTFPREDRPELLEPMRDQLFWNRGPEDGFFDVSPAAGEHFGRSLVGRGAAFADYDRDGDVDVLVVNHGAAPALLRNDGGDRAGRWIQVEARGRRLFPPVGARVRVVAGDRTQIRWIGAQSSYLSQNSPLEHVGLGDSDGVDTVEVTWPDGRRQSWTGLPAGRAVRLVEGEDAWTDVSVKSTGDRSRAAPALSGSVEAAAEAPASREDVLRFWEEYRNATRLRIAGRLEEAERAYGAAIALDGSHEDALYYLGSVRLALGRVGAARAAFERLVRVNPGSGRGHSQLGVLEACPDTGAAPDLTLARASFERAWAINREQTGVPLWLGIVALLDGDPHEARRRFDDVLGSDPGSAVASFLSGYTAWAEGDRAEATRLLRTAVEAVAADPAVETGLGEGDTRRRRPVFAAAASCRWLEDRLDPLADRAAAGSSVSGSETAGLYGDLDRSLRAVRPARRSGGSGS